MITSVNKELVLIEPEKVEDMTEGGLHIANEAKENLVKKQNRGTVIKVGEKCDWAKPDDFVSFYRNAATSIKEDGKDYLIVHEGHILAKIKENA
jgi:co-chaperonin GroES (HSP10)